jgi:pyridoxal phosphate enzyme (YggS family)
MLAENVKHLNEFLKDKKCTLVAVTKTHSVDTLEEAYKLGIKVFGENKVQEMVAKYEVLPKDIAWHMIGHLQSNKVKYIAPFVSLIHSVDGLNLLKEINKQAIKNERVIDCLLQIYIAQEETKFGLGFDEAEEILASVEVKNMHNIRLVGLMGMASNTQDSNVIRQEFRNLKVFYDRLRPKNPHFQTLSMGMSSDYGIALEEGSNLIRVGSALFGNRNYATN